MFEWWEEPMFIMSGTRALIMWTLLPQNLVAAIGLSQNSTATHYYIGVLTKFQNIFFKTCF
jgi:hypothetical protein